MKLLNDYRVPPPIRVNKRIPKALNHEFISRWANGETLLETRHTWLGWGKGVAQDNTLFLVSRMWGNVETTRQLFAVREGAHVFYTLPLVAMGHPPVASNWVPVWNLLSSVEENNEQLWVLVQRHLYNVQRGQETWRTQHKVNNLQWVFERYKEFARHFNIPIPPQNIDAEITAKMARLKLLQR